ncbi:hypothetical protein [Polaribacter sp. M15]
MEIEKDERDLILEFITKEHLKRNNVKSENIRTNLFPNLNKEQVEQLIYEIEKHEPKIVGVFKSGMEVFINSNDLTEQFLKDGGFTEIERIKNEKEIKIEKKENFDFKNSKFKYYSSGIVLLILIATFIYRSCEFSDNDNVNNEEYLKQDYQSEKNTKENNTEDDALILSQQNDSLLLPANSEK